MKVYLGIDVSKGYSDFCFLNEDGNIMIDPFQLDDTNSGYAALFKLLEELTNDKSVEIFAAVESTAGYENNWYNFLFKMTEAFPLFVIRLNPFGVKKLAEASMDRNKTDKTSSYHIAEYLRKYPEKTRYNEENPYQTMRKYWKHIALLGKMLRQISNSLQNIVYSANPELLSQCKYGFSKKTLEILKQYPTARKLSRAQVKRLSKISSVSESDAKKMINSAKTSVSSLNDELTEEIITSSVKQIQILKSQIDSSVKSILKNKRPKEIDLLMSIPGIGEKTAVGLYMEIGPVFRFANSKELASYAGIHPVIRESGDGSKRPKMSKRGRKTLRSILFLPAMVASNTDPHLKQYYEKQLKKGKSKMSSLGIIMHKLLRIVYGVLKSGLPYNADIDRKNTNNKTQIKKDENENSLRRFQKFEESAPISKHAEKKRKQSMSHGVSAQKCSGSKTANNDDNNIL